MLSVVTLAFLLAAGPALAAGGGSEGGGSSGGGSGSSGSENDPSELYDTAVERIESGSYASAIPLLEQVVAAEPENADAWNYLGFAYRNLSNFTEAFAAYDQALRIDPEHDGANEYLGELYLMTGDLAKAEDQLAILDDNCTFSCDEFEQLKAAIDDYKKKQGS